MSCIQDPAVPEPEPADQDWRTSHRASIGDSLPGIHLSAANAWPVRPSESHASERRQQGAAPHRRGPTIAQDVVANLSIPALPPSPPPPRPLPLTGLHRLPGDTSMLYDIGPVDASGRVASSAVVTAVRWQPHDRLELVLVSGAIVLRASPDGLFSVPQRPCIIIPVRARRRYGIRPGDRVLLAAAPDYGTVIVYPLSVLDERIADFHSEHPATGASRA
jgi:hypothetical protein